MSSGSFEHARDFERVERISTTRAVDPLEGRPWRNRSRCALDYAPELASRERAELDSTPEEEVLLVLTDPEEDRRSRCSGVGRAICTDESDPFGAESASYEGDGVA
jgi:hypothetical protein